MFYLVSLSLFVEVTSVILNNVMVPEIRSSRCVILDLNVRPIGTCPFWPVNECTKLSSPWINCGCEVP